MRRLILTLAATGALIAGCVVPAFASVPADPAMPCAQPDGRVSAMAISSGTVYIGGSFHRVKDRSGAWRVRSGLAAVDSSTCELTSWTAAADGAVSAITVTGGVVYIGGSFTHVGGQPRSRIAALDRTAAVVLPFRPMLDKPVRTLAASDTTLYAGGQFSVVNGASRPKLVAFSLVSGTVDPAWRPVAGGAVNTLALRSDGGSVYIGGNFTSLNGDSGFGYLGAVDPRAGVIDSAFRPRALFPILRLAVDSRGIYAGGAGSGGHLATWNLDGSLQRPVYQTDGDVQAVAVDGDSVYAGGHFVNYCVGNTGYGRPYTCDQNLERRKLFEVSLSTGELTPFAPRLDSPFGAFVAAVDPATHALWVGGDFTHVGTQAVAHLVRFG